MLYRKGQVSKLCSLCITSVIIIIIIIIFYPGRYTISSASWAKMKEDCCTSNRIQHWKIAVSQNRSKFATAAKFRDGQQVHTKHFQSITSLVQALRALPYCDRRTFAGTLVKAGFWNTVLCCKRTKRAINQLASRHRTALSTVQTRVRPQMQSPIFALMCTAAAFDGLIAWWRTRRRLYRVIWFVKYAAANHFHLKMRCAWRSWRGSTSWQ